MKVCISWLIDRLSEIKQANKLAIAIYLCIDLSIDYHHDPRFETCGNAGWTFDHSVRCSAQHPDIYRNVVVQCQPDFRNPCFGRGGGVTGTVQKLSLDVGPVVRFGEPSSARR